MALGSIEPVTVLSGQIGGLVNASITIAALIGFTMVGVGTLTVMASRHGQYMQRSNMGYGIVSAVAGMLLVSLTAWISSLSESTFGSTLRADLMSYTAPSEWGALSDVPLLVVRVAALVGLWGVITGIMDVRHASSGQHGGGGLWTGIGKMAGGIAALNFDVLTETIGNSLGSTASGFISAIF